MHRALQTYFHYSLACPGVSRLPAWHSGPPIGAQFVVLTLLQPAVHPPGCLCHGKHHCQPAGAERPAADQRLLGHHGRTGVWFCDRGAGLCTLPTALFKLELRLVVAAVCYCIEGESLPPLRFESPFASPPPGDCSLVWRPAQPRGHPWPGAGWCAAPAANGGKHVRPDRRRHRWQRVCSRHHPQRAALDPGQQPNRKRRRLRQRPVRRDCDDLCFS